MQEFITTFAIHEPESGECPKPEVPNTASVWKLIGMAVACDGSTNKNILYWTWEKLADVSSTSHPPLLKARFK